MTMTATITERRRELSRTILRLAIHIDRLTMTGSIDQVSRLVPSLQRKLDQARAELSALSIATPASAP